MHRNLNVSVKCNRFLADKPVANRVFFSRSVYIGFRLLVLPKRSTGQLFSIPWKFVRQTNCLLPWRTELLASCSTRPRSALPSRRTPPHPNRLWHVRVLDFTTLSSPNSGYNTSGSGRDGAERSGQGRGEASRDAGGFVCPEDN